MQSNCLPSFLLFTEVSLSPSLFLNFPFFLPSFPPSTSIFNFTFHYSMLPATVRCPFHLLHGLSPSSLSKPVNCPTRGRVSCAALHPVHLSNLRLSRCPTSWWPSCWVTRQTSAQWSRWSLGVASSTDPSGCGFLCPPRGRRVPGTLGRATPPACGCSAPS